MTLLSSSLVHGMQSKGEKNAFTPDMEWFKDAGFGIFIHWGIYAVRGEGESWPMFDGYVSREDYYKQLDGFTAAEYDPEAWAALFKEAGARYAVLTTKHHDGVALWDTTANDLSVVKITPAQRDLITPYADALRKKDLKVGFYYSWLDWANEDYLAQGWRNKKERREIGVREELVNPAAWKRFQAFYTQQLDELLAMQPDLLWFDGHWEVKKEFWNFGQSHTQIRARLPDIILNSRIPGYGNYASPEQSIPFYKPNGVWELCMTMHPFEGVAWGYPHNLPDEKKLDASKLIRVLADVNYMGGNLLLNIGPKPDGSIPEWMENNLKQIGAWLSINGEAIYGTRAGIHRNHYDQGSTVSKDGKTLYLFVFSRPENGIFLKGIGSEPKRISILGDETPIAKPVTFGEEKHNQARSRIIAFPEEVSIGHGRVVKVEFDEPVKLMTGRGGEIHAN